MHLATRPFGVSLMLVAAFTTSAGAGVLTVAPSGAAYTDIQAAVTAANPGDLVLVSTGTYGPVTVDGKDLTICADFGATVSIVGTTTVMNVSATQQVVLSNLTGAGVTSSLLDETAGAGLVVADNAGFVRVEACRFSGARGSDTGGFLQFCCDYGGHDEGWDGGLMRDNLAGVSLAGTTLIGGEGLQTNPNCGCGFGAVGGDALRVRATIVSLYDAMLVGGRGGSNGTTGGEGGAACRTIAGASTTGVFASGSSFTGGDGGDGYDGIIWSEGGDGGSGLFVAAGTTVQLLGDQFSGGSGGIAAYDIFPAGSNGLGQVISGTAFTYPGTSVGFEAMTLARGGDQVRLEIQGTPGESVRLVVSSTPTFQVVPSWRGVRLSAIGGRKVDRALGTIPSSGVLVDHVRMPQLPAGTPSRTYYVQAYRADPVGGPTLAAGYAVTVIP